MLHHMTGSGRPDALALGD